MKQLPEGLMLACEPQTYFQSSLLSLSRKRRPEIRPLFACKPNVGVFLFYFFHPATPIIFTGINLDTNHLGGVERKMAVRPSGNKIARRVKLEDKDTM